MTGRTRRLGVIAIAALSLAACQTDDASEGKRVPSEAQARVVLEQYVAAAGTAKTAKDYCTISFLGEGCETDFEWAGGPEAIPTSRPSVVDASRTVGDNIRVLIVCGTDGKGRSYKSDFPVERDTEHGNVRAVMPVYWGGVGFSGKVSGDQPQTAGATGGSGLGSDQETC